MADRDKERQRTYNAEFIVREFSEREGATMELFGTKVTWPVERRFGELDHVRDYVAWVMRQPWFVELFPRAAAVPVKVRYRRGDRAAHYELPATIAVNAPGNKVGWAMREIVVLHELAHHVHEHEGMPGSVHGAEFRGVFCRLVTEVIGPEAGWILQITFWDSALAVVTDKYATLN